MDEAYNDWAGALKYQMKFDKVKAKVSKTIRINPVNSRGYRLMGLFLKDQGHYEEAGQNFRESMKIDPFESRAYYSLARILDDRERFEEAEIEYAKVIELDPDHFKAHYSWGVMLYNQMKYQEAKAKLQDSITADPEDVDALFGYGLVCGYLGDSESEEKMYFKAIDLIKDDRKSIDQEIASYEENLQELNTKLSDCIENKVKEEHFRRAIDGTKQFLAMLHSDKKL